MRTSKKAEISYIKKYICDVQLLNILIKYAYKKETKNMRIIFISQIEN